MSTTILRPSPASFAQFAREIRNPLCVITLACDMLGDDLSYAEQKTYLDMVRKAALQISREVNTLLTEDINNQ